MQLTSIPVGGGNKRYKSKARQVVVLRIVGNTWWLVGEPYTAIQEHQRMPSYYRPRLAPCCASQSSATFKAAATSASLLYRWKENRTVLRLNAA